MAAVAPYARQPWKTIYITSEVLLIITLLPVWAVTFLFTRPRPTWSWTQSMLVAVVRRLADMPNAVGAFLPFPDYRAIEPTSNAEGAWIDGVPDLITAELKVFSAVANVAPVRIPGYWYAKKGFPRKPASPVEPNQRVFLLIHGGAFTQLSAHPKCMTSTLPQSLVELSDNATHALSVEYRRSSISPLPDQHPFPAALLDCARRIQLPRNLALALARYLVENKGTADVPLPSPPGHLLLVSPWADLSNSHATPGSAAFTNNADVIGSFYTGRGISAGFPRTFIIAGGAERLVDQIRTLRDKMAKDMEASQVGYYEGTDAIHDYFIFTWHPGRFDVLKAIQEWLA
ncbi:Alpha/Beta hydrolase protein [Pisolithus orientalis]|uniref:Alpha/Beta hydrolase protein n=1 Tax=Pisolithus orientalis TaxID=936130 RepID=UPI00222524FF|nr:Alpha/Beta hydrolase protein [Pisolithus orientalis]KAI5995769.1 Alpha/Beta hydrolase protein [Pisolithus orientalis]